MSRLVMQRLGRWCSWRRVVAVVAVIGAVSALALGLGYAKRATGQQEAAAAQDSVAVAAYIVPGLPLRVTSVGVTNTKGFAELSYALTNQSSQQIEYIHFLLFNFNPAGKLRGVEGWVRRVALTAGATKDFTFKLEKRITPGNRAVLAVATVGGVASDWRVAPAELTQTVITLVAGQLPVAPPIEQSAEPLTEDHGPSFCNSALLAATNVARTKGNFVISAFGCDQQNQSYVVSYRAD